MLSILLVGAQSGSLKFVKWVTSSIEENGHGMGGWIFKFHHNSSIFLSPLKIIDPTGGLNVNLA